MTDKLIEQIKADPETGTHGPWYKYAVRRIARVPDMEARILADAKVIEAAKAMAEAWGQSPTGSPDCCATAKMEDALAAFNEALDSAANAAMKGEKK